MAQLDIARIRSYHPAHADVALSALRNTPGRDGQVLGLPTIQHGVRHLSELPAVGCRPARLLRARSRTTSTAGRRDPGLLGGLDHPDRGRAHGPRAAGAAAVPPSRCWNPCSEARIRRGRRRAGKATTTGCGECLFCRTRRRGLRAGRAAHAGQPGRAALEPVGRRRGLTSCATVSPIRPRGPRVASRG